MDGKLLGSRIKSRRIELDMTQGDIAEAIGVAVSTIQRYEAGSIQKIKLPVVEAVARCLCVNANWLVGKSEIKESPVSERIALSTLSTTEDMPNNVTPIATDRIPLVGRIACGEPILAEEHIEDHVDLPRHIKADFALECSGDSMIGAGIRDGDIVYIRKQPTVENGEIAAVVIDGEEATLKRFYRSGNKVTLSAENPAYDPFVYVGEEINTIRIVGRAVGFTHKL